MAHPAKGYRLPDGDKVPGVTTIIGRFKEANGLLWWACQQGQKNPDLPVRDALYGARDEAGMIGTAVHWMVEQHVKGSPLRLGGSPVRLEDCDALDMDGDTLDLTDDRRQQIQSGYDAYLAWERMTRLKITHQEIQLVSVPHRFGGCPDAIGEIDGEPCLLDWKTSKSVYPDMLIQLAAYGHLVRGGLQMEHDYKPLGITVNGFHLCKFSKMTGDFSHHYYQDLAKEWEQFKRFRDCWDADKLIKARAA